MTRQTAFHAWADGPALQQGVHQGTRVVGSQLGYGDGAGVRSYTDPHVDGAARVTYDWAIWLSPHIDPGFAFTSLVPSWKAQTPAGTWIDVEVRVSSDGIHMGRWYTLGRWASDDSTIRPTTVPGQDDDQVRLEADVLAAAEGVSFSTYQLRVALLRRPDVTDGPTVSLVGAEVAAGPPPR